MKKLTLVFCILLAKQLTALCQLSPSSDNTNYQKGLDYEQQEYFPTANYYYEKARLDALARKDTLLAARAGLRAAVCDNQKMDFQDALKRLPEVIQFLKAQKGEKDNEYADALFRYGVAWSMKGFYDKGNIWLEKAEKIFEAKGDKFMLHKVYFQYASNTSCYPEKRRWLDSAWEMYNNQLQKEPLEELKLLIADVYYFSDLGQKNELNDNLKKAKNIVFSLDSNSVSRAIQGLGLAFFLDGKEKEMLTAQAEKCFREKLGNHSIRLARHNMTKASNQPENSEQLLRTAAQIIKDSLDGDTILAAQILWMDGVISSAINPQESFSENLIMTKEEIIRVLETYTKGNHPQLFSNWTSIASNYANTGNFEKAVFYWNKAKRAYQEQCGHECIQVASILKDMAPSLAKYYNNPDTIDYCFAEAVRIVKKIGGGNSTLLTSEYYPILADRMMSKGKFSEALPLLLYVDSIMIAQNGREDFLRFENLFYLSYCHLHLSNYIKRKDVGHEMLYLSQEAPPQYKNHLLMMGYNIILVYFQMNPNQDSLAYYLKKSIEYTPIGTMNAAMLRASAAKTYYDVFGDWQKYKDLLFEAKLILEFDINSGVSNSSSAMNIYMSLAQYYGASGQCDSLSYYLDQWGKIATATYLPGSQELFNYKESCFTLSYSCNNNTGEQYLKEVEALMKEALTLYPPEHQTVINYQAMLSAAYDITGNFEMKNYYFEKVVEAHRRQMEKNPGALEYELSYLEKLGDYYSQRGNPDEAKEVFEDALAKAEKGVNQKYIRNFSQKLANYHKDKEAYDSAIQYIEKAISSQPANDQYGLNQLATSHTNLGRLLLKQKKTRLAELHFASAAAIADTISIDAVSRAVLLNSCSFFYETTGQYQKAASLAQRSIDLLESKKSQQIQGEAMTGKYLSLYYMTLARIYRKWHEGGGSPQNLAASEQATQKMLSYTNALTENLGESEENQLASNIQTAGFYHEAMLVKQTAGAPVEEIWALAEQGKSATLRSQINAQKALLANEALNGVEQQIRATNKQIAAIETSRFEFEQNAVRNKLEYQPILTEELAKAKTVRKQLLQQLKTSHPEVYNARFDNATISISAVRIMLTDKQSLLSFSFLDSTVIVCLINKDTALVQSIVLDFPLKNWVDDLSNEIRKDQLAYDVYVPAASGLYEKLLKPFQPWLTEQLVILPDGLTYKIPFEILLKSKPSNLKSDEMGKLDFLVKHHEISYNNSASVWLEMKERKLPERKSSFDLIAFAPSYTGTEEFAWGRGMDTIDYRQGFNPLKHNQPEATEIVRESKNSKAFVGKYATEEAFINNAPNCRICHFSGHAKAFDRKGNFSFMAFYEIKDSTENEWLYAREIYSLPLHLEMMVISGCETGLGTLSSGEGIIGLGRSLSYAGVKSMVISLWSVSDESTKELMVAFYDYLRQGWTKDSALRQAKLNLIAQGKAPFLWAPFVVYGDCGKVY